MSAKLAEARGPAEPLVAASSDWLELTSAWEYLDETRYGFAREALGASAPCLDWSGFSDWLVGRAVARPRGEGLVLRRRVAVAAPGTAARALIRRLLTHWQEAQRPELLGDAVRWAVQLGAWDELSEIWRSHLHLARLAETPGALEAFAELPEAARASAPLLTWARALARAEAASPANRDDVLLRSVLADSVQIHSGWADADRTEIGVLSGTIVMISQRFMPTSPIALALDAAWTTQNAVAAFLARRRREGRPPEARDEVVFRAASAQLALARADFDQAVAEADYAIAIEPDLANRLAGGTRDLALELAGCGSSERRSSSAEPTRGRQWLHRDPASVDLVAAKLATAHAALRKLDRDATEAALRDLAASQPGPTQWTTTYFVEAMHAALWGNPTQALAKLDSAKLRRGPAALEQHELLGGVLLARARIALLDRLGAHGAAIESARALPAPWRWLSRSRSLLWAGEFEEAHRVAASGIYDPGTPVADRLALRAIRAGLIALQPDANATENRELICDSLKECVRDHRLLALGLLPKRVRVALLAHCGDAQEDVATDELFLKLAQRLASLSTTGDHDNGPVQLTRREQVLLPLLASADSVPDIAHDLHVSANTVRKQVVTLRAKFGAASRAELVRRARDTGLLK